MDADSSSALSPTWVAPSNADRADPEAGADSDTADAVATSGQEPGFVRLCAPVDPEGNQNKEYGAALKSCLTCPGNTDGECCEGQRCIAVPLDTAACDARDRVSARLPVSAWISCMNRCLLEEGHTNIRNLC